MKRLLISILLLFTTTSYAEDMQLARTNPYVAGAIYSDAIAPTVTSCTIAANGTSVTLNFSEPVVTTGYDDNDCDLDCTTGGDNITLDTITGSGSSKAGLTADTTVVSGETCNLDCTIGADEIEDASGNDLANITSMACTNNSTQGGLTCGTEVYLEYTNETDKDYDSIGDGTTHIGNRFTTSNPAEQICKVCVYVGYSTQNDTFRIKVYEMSGANLGTLKCTSNTIAIDAYGWKCTDTSTLNCSLSASTAHAVVMEAVTQTGNELLYFNTTATLTFTSEGKWADTAEAWTSATKNALMKLYKME